VSGTPPVFTRRTALGGAALAGAGTLLSPVAGLAAGLQRSRVFSRWVGTVRGESAVLTAPRRFALAGVQWSGPAMARIELRVRRRGGTWGPWALASVTGHDAEPRSGATPMFGEPIWVSVADQFQLRVAPGARQVRVHFVAGPDRPAGSASASALASDAAVALPLAQPILPAGPGQPQIIARDAWAGRHAAPAGPAGYGSVRLAFVHHTDNPNGYSEAQVAPMLLAIFDYHRYVRGFFDIAYNFLIDAFGRIWEGRAGGIDEPVIGAHAGGYNLESTGVAILGTFIASVPPPPAMTALEQLLAWKLSLHGVPAVGKVSVEVDPFGAVYTPFAPGSHVLLPRVAGHRDGDQTDCPGDALYHRLPEVRRHVNAIVGTPARLSVATPRLTVAPGAVVPLTGRLTALSGGAPLPGATIEIQALAADAATTIATAVTAADGTWSATVTVSRDAVLRALHAEAPATVSEVLAVGVAPALTLALTAAAPLRVAGTVTPAKPRITLDIYRQTGQHRQLLTSQRVTVHGGAFSVRPALGARRGRHYVLIARTVAGGQTLAGASAPLAITY
jgi:hypothetical protein